MSIKLIIFDFDGTISDTSKPIIFAKQETMKQLGLPVADAETCASTIGLSCKLGFKNLYPDLSEETLDNCVTLYRKTFDSVIKTMPPELFPGVIETLDKLSEMQLRMTIATSRNRKSLDEFMALYGLDKYFDYTLSGDDTPLLKPNPDPVLKTLEDLSFLPEETLVVGDMDFDIQMGKRAGALTCGVTYGNSSREQLLNFHSDFLIDSMPQLIEILTYLSISNKKN